MKTTTQQRRVLESETTQIHQTPSISTRRAGQEGNSITHKLLLLLGKRGRTARTLVSGTQNSNSSATVILEHVGCPRRSSTAYPRGISWVPNSPKISMEYSTRNNSRPGPAKKGRYLRLQTLTKRYYFTPWTMTIYDQ